MPPTHEYPVLKVDLTETGYAAEILRYANSRGVSVPTAVVELLTAAVNTGLAST
jgi:hypothetical protein